MGKLIRNGIEYGGGNGTDIFEVTQSEYDTLKQAGTLVHNALYVITDAQNLNPTASDIEYSSGVTVKQAIDSKQDAFTSGSFTANTNVTILNGFYNQTGDMVFWSCCFSVSSGINTGTKILSGLPHKNEQDNLPCFLREISATDNSASCRIYRGDLYPNVALTSGKTYHAMGVYTID